MKCVIVGYGRVGSRTARVLREEGHDLTIVDNNERKVDRARDEGFDAILGDGGTESVLKEAGIEDADAIGGLTGDPNINFAACMLGKEFGCRTVMRISEDYRQEIYERYADGVDEIVYPERLGAAGAKTALLGGDFNAIGDLTDQLSLTTVRVPEGAPIIGEHVANIDLGSGGRVYAHGRKHESMTIPLPGTIVEPGDQLALIAERDALKEVRSKLLG
ncbi:TrkA family potassium uptake protein [Haloferax mediterranei ATCC 33500]|uniref:Potassium transporter Trk n=1 Tax=Haloferax mediterranei (strain ATCC 33500 / DSM 1411 / JCM 8866 / NBRC 14739 / NCIMB 2177 / R-4) TaxID=523841 RepID=I3R612_HALMT|nr:TrkA family potassium uptake protein [Haloferax mediterranei]AFK19672.2 TRK potassium uptake system protein [Haloferax mediterranei ATCC 33500]AHZ23061.1 potassium transporter Trk [Haloferax mediterranei ATCC 33500]ELZ99992.1 TRK potassium uptake system protein [Haloferax mediterranei ATCC 33500]MDX5987586.1 TrkA family potassium uptake protein [Haloferax mediterranei ATCC 33500]QCQ74075.1 TrkA family potassium uptake protein [Haloferax mediterranei ATCC 33500]